MKCLDHAASKKEQIVPGVTGKVYNRSKWMKEKRTVLDGVTAELRRIIGEPVQRNASCLISVIKVYQSSNPANWTT